MTNAAVLSRVINAATAMILIAGLAAGCATVTRYDAASDIGAFLTAVRDGDDAAFEAHVDRPALKDNLKARLLAATARRYGVESKQTLGALVLAGPLANVAVDGLVRPQVFSAAASLLGYGPETKIPNALVLGHQVKPLDDQRVCVIAKGQCVFVFRREEGTWRMIAFEGDVGLLDRKAAGSGPFRGLL